MAEHTSKIFERDLVYETSAQLNIEIKKKAFRKTVIKHSSIQKLFSRLKASQHN
jgi:hypothetical protein